MTAASLFTVQPGDAPTLLYPNPPSGIYTVNTDLNNSVWIDADPSLHPGGGFEVGPQGYIQWTGTDALFAICDTGVNSPIKLRCSANVGDASNPLTIIGNPTINIANGQIVGIDPDKNQVTPVLIEDVLANNANIPGAGSLPVDISGYETVEVISTGGAVGALSYQLLDPNGNILDQDILITGPGSGARLAATGATLKLLNNIGGIPGAKFVTVIGSNRSTPFRNDQRQSSKLIDEWSVAAVAGSLVNLVQNDPAIYMDGPCTAFFQVASAATTGRFQLVDAAGTHGAVIINTAEMTAMPGGGLSAMRQIGIPPGASWQFNGTAGANMVYVFVTANSL